MVGFEVIVRPVVFPNIRPAPTRSVPPEDNPEQDFAVISGSSGGFVDLPFSFSSNVSMGSHNETERTFDEARIFQKDSGGTVNRSNFVDVQVPKKIKMTGGSLYKYAPIEEADNIEILRRNVTRTRK